MQNTADIVKEYLTAHKREMIEDMKYIVSFPSVKTSPEPDAPFGRNCADCLAAAASLYTRDGFETEIYAASGYALSYYPHKPAAGEGYTGIFSHSDVVPVIDSDWTLTEPFKAVYLEENDMIVGRGCDDNKSAVIGGLYIFRALRENGITPDHPLCMFVGSNEESGMVDLKNFVKEQPAPAVCIVPDGGFPVSFGERAGTKYDVTSRAKLSDVADINGGNAYNTVMGTVVCDLKYNDRLAACLTGCNDENLTVSVDNGIIHATVQGISAHAGRPYKGDSALRRLSVILASADGLCDGDREIFAEISRILGDPYGEYMGIAAEDPDMGRLGVANGKTYMDDGHIVFTFDIRFGPVYGKEELKSMVKSFLESKGFDVKCYIGTEAFKIDPENPYAITFLESYRRLTGHPDAKAFYMAGGTYSRHLENSFSTGATYGKFRARFPLPAGHGSAHESDEILGVSEWIEGMRIIGGILMDMDKAY